jgi:hypothetical protein
MCHWYEKRGSDRPARSGPSLITHNNRDGWKLV